MQDSLRDGISALGVTVGESSQRRLLAYLALLAKWNRVYNLTAVRDVRDMLPVHLLDSLAVLPLVDERRSTTVLDVGSGAGLPGIPLAIARPGLDVTTVDAVAKKISFQQQAKTELNLANVHPRHVRVETLTLAESPSLIVSRAYSAIPDMLASIASLCGEHTVVIAMKGEPPLEELAALPDGWRVDEVRELDVPLLGARRCAVVLARAPAPGLRETDR
jgi:16S rRNA (guanine527-N7)-methyltransferase